MSNEQCAMPVIPKGLIYKVLCAVIQDYIEFGTTNGTTRLKAKYMNYNDLELGL